MTRRSWERIGESERQLYQQQLHLLQQSLGAIKDVKVTGRQPFFEERFRHVKRELGATKQRRAWAATLARLGVEATLILSMLLVVFLVMRQDTSGGDTVSVLALFAYTGFRVVPSANRIMLNVGYMREAHPWIRNMDEDMRKLRVPAAANLRTRSAADAVDAGVRRRVVRLRRRPAARARRGVVHDRARPIDRHRRADRRRQEHAGRRAARPAAADDRARAGRRRAARRPRARVAAADRLRLAGRLSAGRFAAPQHRVRHSRRRDRRSAAGARR